jgi:ATP-dependent RNA helicase RhlE
MLFSDLNISDTILRALHDEGYRTPTPIQQQAIPIVLEGKDLLGVAQTGTGKTAAFAIPIIQTLSEHPLNRQRGHAKHRPIRSLILTPTRELAIQIDDSIHAYGRYAGLTSTVIFGGVKQGQQTTALRRGVDIVVATPGRLLDLMDQGFAGLQDVEIFVLDEADRMLDMGFVRDVERIIAALPKDRQSLFFSATMPPAIVKLSHGILDHPVRVEVTPPSSTVDIIDQKVYHVEKSKKPSLLMHLLDDPDMDSVLVFTRTKHGADQVVKTLDRNGVSAEAIHGNKAQNARQRALTNFKNGRTRVLVATDIAARGIDVDNLQYVINYEIPNVPETYVHRIGRTGRAGATGTAFSFCMPEEKAYLKDIEKLIGKRIPVAHDHPVATSERRHASDEAPTLRAHQHERKSEARHANAPRKEESHREHSAGARPELKLAPKREHHKEHPAKPKAVSQSGAPAAPRNKKKAKSRWNRRRPAR